MHLFLGYLLSRKYIGPLSTTCCSPNKAAEVASSRGTGPPLVRQRRPSAPLPPSTRKIKHLYTSHFLQTSRVVLLITSLPGGRFFFFFCTIAFVTNIWWRHTIISPSMTAVHSCIAHGGEMQSKPKPCLTLYIEPSCSFNSECQSLSAWTKKKPPP